MARNEIQVHNHMVEFWFTHEGEGSRKVPTALYSLWGKWATPDPIVTYSRSLKPNWRLPATRVLKKLALKFLKSEIEVEMWTERRANFRINVGIPLEDRAAFLAAVAARAYVE